MKKSLFFTLVILAITVVLTANAQKVGVPGFTIKIDMTPRKVELFPGVYVFYGTLKGDSSDSSNGAIHAITLDTYMADVVLNKKETECVLLLGPVLDDVSIDLILSYAKDYLAVEEKDLKQNLSYLKEESAFKKDIVCLKRELCKTRKKSKSRLKELEKRLKKRAQQSTIYIQQIGILDRPDPN